MDGLGVKNIGFLQPRSLSAVEEAENYAVEIKLSLVVRKVNGSVHMWPSWTHG